MASRFQMGGNDVKKLRLTGKTGTYDVNVRNKYRYQETSWRHFLTRWHC